MIARLAGHVGRVFSARFVAGGEILTAGGDSTVRRWDVTTGQLRQTYQDAARFVADAVLDPSGLFVVGGGAEGMLQFWDAASGRLLWKLHAHKSHLIALRFEGEDLVTRGFGGDVAHWTLPAPDRVIDATTARAQNR
jgi:WD40 repeat protein